MIGSSAAPINAVDKFSEAISVIPIVHTPLSAARVLIIGQAALPAAWLAMRYPQFTDIISIGADAPPSLLNTRRFRQVPSLDQVPGGWLADLIVIASPTVDSLALRQVHAHSSRNAVVAVACPSPAGARMMRDTLRSFWSVVAPYREHLPEPAYFLLASNAPLTKVRPVPAYTRRISDNYLPAMFTWGKDEYATLFGKAA